MSNNKIHSQFNLKKEQERMVKEDPQFFFIDTPVGEIGGHVRQGFPNQKFNQTANKNK